MAFITELPAVFNMEALEIHESSNMDEIVYNIYENLVSSIENIQQCGWVLDKLPKFDLLILEFNPLHATSHIPLPEDLQRKQAIINTHKRDEKCFLWSVIAGTYLQGANFRNLQRLKAHRQYKSKFNFEGISLPVAFECRNNVCIPGYGSIPVYVQLKIKMDLCIHYPWKSWDDTLTSYSSLTMIHVTTAI